MALNALTPYHVGEQRAAVLLGPVDIDLATIETRLAHYRDRLRMADTDRQTLARAHELLSQARAEIAALRDNR